MGKYKPFLITAGIVAVVIILDKLTGGTDKAVAGINSSTGRV